MLDCTICALPAEPLSRGFARCVQGHIAHLDESVLSEMFGKREKRDGDRKRRSSDLRIPLTY